MVVWLVVVVVDTLEDVDVEVEVLIAFEVDKLEVEREEVMVAPDTYGSRRRTARGGRVSCTSMLKMQEAGEML